MRLSDYKSSLKKALGSIDCYFLTQKLKLGFGKSAMAKRINGHSFPKSAMAMAIVAKYPRRRPC